MSDVKRLADRHEQHVASMLGAKNSRASGSQWHDQADGRMSRYADQFAWAFDCKCALPQTKSIGVSREMWVKIEEQAHGNRPMIPLRFYSTSRGDVFRDLVVITLDDLVELLEQSKNFPRGITRADL